MVLLRQECSLRSGAKLEQNRVPRKNRLLIASGRLVIYLRGVTAALLECVIRPPASASTTRDSTLEPQMTNLDVDRFGVLAVLARNV